MQSGHTLLIIKAFLLYLVVENRQIFTSKDRQSIKRFMRVYIHPARTGDRDIGMAWGGLYISTRAFGDASTTIFSETSSHA